MRVPEEERELQNEAGVGERTEDYQLELLRLRQENDLLATANHQLRVEAHELSRAKEAIGNSEAFLSAIIEKNPIPIWISDSNGTLTWLNKACCNLLKIRESEVVGKYNILKDEVLKEQGLLPLLRRTFENGEVARFEIVYDSARIRHLTLEETTARTLDVTVFPIIDASGTVTNAIIEHVDITDRRRAQDALLASEDMFRSIIEATPIPLALNDDQLNVTYLNSAFINIFGYTLEDIPKLDAWWNKAYPDPDYRRWVAETWQTRLEDAKRDGLPFVPMEVRIRQKDGGARTVLASAAMFSKSPRGVHLVVLYDITDRKRVEAQQAELEAQNRQLHKAESLGRMAGAIAHQFNNHLQAVIGNLELAFEDVHQDSGLAQTLTAAMRSACKATEVSGQMLAYLGQTPAIHEEIDLAEACRRYTPMLRALVPSTVNLQTDLPSCGPVIRASTNQIQQVLTNLVTNAWEAVGEGPGSVYLKVSILSPTEIPNTVRRPVDWLPKDTAHACLEVTDSGCGIDEKGIERLFDPFYSTKFTGRGLGLPVTLGIVKAHRGVVTVSSELGKGSVFRVIIPISLPQVTRHAKDSPPRPVTTDGTVLLVEDETMVRKTVAAMLIRLGFKVIEAADGLEAVAIFRQRHTEIRCVLCDLTMPRMNGWKALEALRELAPGAVVVLASGMDEAGMKSGDHKQWPNAFLSKPYQLKQLRDTIEKVLGSE